MTERTNFRLSYAHQVQAPDFALVLGGINTDLAVTNTNHVYGSDLDFGKTITFEFGIRHAFSDDMVLDISAYNQRQPVQRRRPPAVRCTTRSSCRTRTSGCMTNADFGNTAGSTCGSTGASATCSTARWRTPSADAKNTGSDPFTYINFGSRVVNQVSRRQPAAAAGHTCRPTYTRPHNLAGCVLGDLPERLELGHRRRPDPPERRHLRDVPVRQRHARTPRCPVETGNESVLSAQVCAAAASERRLNSARLPTFKKLDLRFTKGFGFGGVDLTAYLDARNILNFTNVHPGRSPTTNGIENAIELQADLVRRLSRLRRRGHRLEQRTTLDERRHDPAGPGAAAAATG